MKNLNRFNKKKVKLTVIHLFVFIYLHKTVILWQKMYLKMYWGLISSCIQKVSVQSQSKHFGAIWFAIKSASIYYVLIWRYDMYPVILIVSPGTYCSDNMIRFVIRIWWYDTCHIMTRAFHLNPHLNSFSPTVLPKYGTFLPKKGRLKSTHPIITSP